MRILGVLLLLALAGALTWGLLGRLAEGGAVASGPGLVLPVPVELGAVERGPITLRRTFSGTLESNAEFLLASKVAGRVERLEVDLGDTVERGQVVATIDDDELEQELLRAEADLAVARASHAEAKSALESAQRELKRAESLRQQGVASESFLDAALTQDLARRASVEVAAASILRAEAQLETARIRLGHARVTANWTGGDSRRVVAERLVNEGSTVSPSVPLMSIVELDPLVGVVLVPERDYAHLAPGQVAVLTTDSYPGRSFEGRVARIAPVFQRSTRQARVELLVENGGENLRPGMFVRATLELERVEEAVIVPFEALSERAGVAGVFLFEGGPSGDGTSAEGSVRWVPVEVGVRDGTRVQIVAQGLEGRGRVVTLGQELCDDGARVSVPAPTAAAAAR